MYLMAAYDPEIGERLTLKPSTMLRYIESAPLSWDLTMALNYGEIVEFGAAYRLDEGFGGFLIFDLADSFKIGYAYEASMRSALNSTNNGTHEIFQKLSL